MKTFLFIAVTAASLANAQLPTPADYQQAAAILNGQAPPAKQTARKGSSTRHVKQPDIVGTISSGAIEVHRQAPLPSSAQLALALSAGWLNGAPPPATSSDGRVLYVYGQGLPVLVCSVLQVCELDLEPGETPGKDALDWGDHRFEIATRTAGSGARQFTYLVLKPTEPGLDTTMTIGTDKRSYYLRLVSTEHEHMARVGFMYPEEEAEKRNTQLAAQQAEQERQKAEAERLAKLSTAKPIRNWRYRVKLHGKDAAYLRPDRIGDDGTHTHILLPEEARRRGLPVVEISDARGPIPANARWDGNELIIDAVFARACLLEGVGKKQQRACITNQGLQPAGSQRHD